MKAWEHLLLALGTDHQGIRPTSIRRMPPVGDGPGATDTAGIIPEIAAMLSGLAEPPQLEPDQARFRLFDSVATFIKNSAASTPLAFVLDDLQWADYQGRREIVPAGRSKTMPLNAAV